ncbi:hypothetical protein [Streptomyces sp. 5-10]|uniref:hypothetical protein n=1 Tax=Streptomyces sp. 5-10 TaxID=878925 RepID=UPI00168BAFF3|nr:hypothetical protein [Streptomyces sp. 5-10]MBD3004635.1 hypothetical protein [Streptomyces sp. 5-10]
MNRIKNAWAILTGRKQATVLSQELLSRVDQLAETWDNTSEELVNGLLDEAEEVQKHIELVHSQIQEEDAIFSQELLTEIKQLAEKYNQTPQAIAEAAVEDISALYEMNAAMEAEKRAVLDAAKQVIDNA